MCDRPFGLSVPHPRGTSHAHVHVPLGACMCGHANNDKATDHVPLGACMCMVTLTTTRQLPTQLPTSWCWCTVLFTGGVCAEGGGPADDDVIRVRVQPVRVRARGLFYRVRRVGRQRDLRLVGWCERLRGDRWPTPRGRRSIRFRPLMHLLVRCVTPPCGPSARVDCRRASRIKKTTDTWFIPRLFSNRIGLGCVGLGWMHVPSRLRRGGRTRPWC